MAAAARSVRWLRSATSLETEFTVTAQYWRLGNGFDPLYTAGPDQRSAQLGSVQVRMDAGPAPAPQLSFSMAKELRVDEDSPAALAPFIDASGLQHAATKTAVLVQA